MLGGWSCPRVTVNISVSLWKPLTRGIPQRSILGPIFNIFINDIASGIECTLSKFADNTKLNRAVDLLEGKHAMQWDQDRLEEWMYANFTKFNKPSERPCTWVRQDELIWRRPEEKVLEILADEKIYMSWQHAVAAQKANCILGCVKRRVASRAREVVFPLYSSVMRPHLEYSIQLWGPHYKKGRDLLDQV